MLVRKANETNSHNSVSIWSTVDCWKRDWRPRTAAWKRAAVSGSCHGNLELMLFNTCVSNFKQRKLAFDGFTQF